MFLKYNDIITSMFSDLTKWEWKNYFYWHTSNRLHNLQQASPCLNAVSHKEVNFN